MTTYQTAAFGVYTIGVEVSGKMPEAAWLAGWLRDLIAREKAPLHPRDGAAWLAAKIEGQWSGGRKYFLEVQDSNRVGRVRVDGICARPGTN